MNVIIRLPEYWSSADIRDVVKALRADTTVKTDRDALADALAGFIDLDVLMEAVRKS